ncbi:conserved hypothetical protein [Trichinella spiralis]|uniref:hypothetical protein n=1 Tax=Trichinella spiralis TaxID=6334 RepID=UPI0001EFBD79|nr:conserved hypothetical protein [Trichinella spiralis]
MNQFTRKRSYPSLLDSVSCATSYGAPSMRIAIIYLPHHRLSLTLLIKDQFQAGRPAEAQLGKSGRNNPAPGCWESCLELPGSRLFRNRTQISPLQGERQFTPQEHMKGKQLLVPAGDNLKRPIPAPAVTLSQHLHTILCGKN